MEVSKCVWYLLVFGMLCSASVAEENDTGLESADTSECQGVTGKWVDDLVRALLRCPIPSSFSILHLNHTAGEGESRVHAQVFCDSLPATRQCFIEETNRWSRCHNQTLNKLFGVLREVLENFLVDSCEDRGEPLSSILQWYNNNKMNITVNNPFFRECFAFAAIKLKTAQTSQAAVPSKLWYFYHEIGTFKDCLVEHIVNDDSFVTLAVDKINRILDTMKCLHPADESVVLCKQIDSASVDRAGLCPLKTKNELLVSRSLLVQSRALRCFFSHYDPYSPKLIDAESPEDVREYFRKYCLRDKIVKHCLSETSLVAEVCLEGAGLKTLKLIRRYLELVLEAGCFQEGRRLATVFNMAHVFQSSANQSVSLLSCLSEAQAKRTKKMDDPLIVYNYYQELDVVRSCLLNKVVGDATFHTDVNEFIDHMKENMQCFDPHDGSVVLCKTIDNV